MVNIPSADKESGAVEVPDTEMVEGVRSTVEGTIEDEAKIRSQFLEYLSAGQILAAAEYKGLHGKAVDLSQEIKDHEEKIKAEFLSLLKGQYTSFAIVIGKNFGEEIDLSEELYKGWKKLYIYSDTKTLAAEVNRELGDGKLKMRSSF